MFTWLPVSLNSNHSFIWQPSRSAVNQLYGIFHFKAKIFHILMLSPIRATLIRAWGKNGPFKFIEGCRCIIHQYSLTSCNLGNFQMYVQILKHARYMNYSQLDNWIILWHCYYWFCMSFMQFSNFLCIICMPFFVYFHLATY